MMCKCKCMYVHVYVYVVAGFVFPQEAIDGLLFSSLLLIGY